MTAAYIRDALKTLSPSWHGDRVALAQFKGRLNNAIEAANQLDKVKKSLFYGRDNNLIADGQMPISEQYINDRIENYNAANIVHGIIGVFTEAGELLEALKASLNNDTIDAVNIREEIGDLFWYVAILLNETGGSFEETMNVNIAKLKARFPASFEADYANNRNLIAERAILEGVADTYADGDIEPLRLAPSAPVSGATAVAEATASAKAAFDAVNSVGISPTPVEAPVNPELAKGIGERLAPMPQETMARENNPK